MNGPQAPDPVKTAEAQSQFNTKAATTQQQLNMVNTSNPFGSTNYSQDGTWADGTPKFSQSTSLNPQMQGAVDGAMNTLSQPFSMDTNAIESRLMDLQRSRIDPMLSQRRESTEQSLFNRGVRPGTEAYDRAMGAVSEGENDQWNQLALNGRQQALSELLTARSQPINELTAMLSGSQINGQNPQAGVSPVDYTGLVNNKYQADKQNHADTWAAVGNIAKTAGGWMFSDERLKEDIHATGEKTADGIPLKTFRYKGSPMMQVGVIAQEAKKKRPDAVRKGPGGFMMVNARELMGA